jgi:predicted Ser/Thr protein kinase
MNAAEWQRVSALFDRALDEAPADADAWLAREAPGDPVLRAEVGSLLDHHVRAGAFLEEPVAARVPALLDEDDGLTPGAVVGPYTIVQEIGRGGMGRVYLASDSRLGARMVALKALAPSLTRDPAHRERLRREAIVAAGLTHSGICTVYALDEIDGALFIATEFVDGRTLREEIVDGRPSADELVRVLTELAAALASAHAAGVTHRDLKPENVMRTAAGGRVKILDFGLARADAAGSTAAAAPAGLTGTPAYMAPEQLVAQPADARADVFALGVTAYEFASGVHPFAAPNELAVIARILDGHARPLAERCPQLSPAIAAVIDRCLQRRPGDRFTSATEIAAALAAATADGAFAAGHATVAWWRLHQIAMLGVYVAASAVAWAIKESFGGAASLWIFVIIGCGSAVAGIVRAHLLFTVRMNPSRLPSERRRAARVTMIADLLTATALFADALLFTPVHPLSAILTMALAAGIALAALLIEPATTRAAFGSDV